MPAVKNNFNSIKIPTLGKIDYFIILSEPYWTNQKPEGLKCCLRKNGFSFHREPVLSGNLRTGHGCSQASVGLDSER